jgi:hypothetical protein
MEALRRYGKKGDVESALLSVNRSPPGRLTTAAVTTAAMATML